MAPSIMLVLLAALAVSGARFGSYSGYRLGDKFIYNYETQALSGTTDQGAIIPQFAGLKLQAKVQIQFKGQDRFHVQFVEARLCKVNGELAGVSPQEPVPMSHCEEHNTEEVQHLTHHLQTPFTFSWIKGQVVSFEVIEGEPAPVVNLKRGLLQLFSIDIEKKNEITINPMPFKTVPVSAAHDYWFSQEVDMVGDCVSSYAAIRSVEGEEVTHFVTKVRDYDQCIHRPVHSNGIFSEFHLNTIKNTQNAVNIQTGIEYVLKGEQDMVIIQKAVLKSRVNVNTLEQFFKQHPVAFVHQQLELVNVQAVRGAIRAPGQFVRKNPFYMEIPEPAYQVQQEQEAESSWGWTQSRRSTYPNVAEVASKPEVEQAAYEYLEKAVPLNHAEPLMEEHTNAVLNLVVMLKEMTTEQLRGFVVQIVQDGAHAEGQAYMKKTIVLDLLPTLGRADVVYVIRDLYVTGLISAEDMAINMGVISITCQPAKEHIIYLIEFAKTTEARSAPQVQRTALLTAGTWTNKIIMLFKNLHQSAEVERDHVTPIRHALAHAFTGLISEVTAADQYYTLTIIKAVENTGLYELIPEIEHIAYNTAFSGFIRSKAVYALIRMPYEAKLVVREICMALYMDQRQPERVRIAAFITCMHTNPGYGTVQTIAYRLGKETSVELRNFVYTYLVGLTTHNDYLSRQIELALRMTPFHMPGFQTSHNIRIPIFTDMIMKWGIELNMDVIHSYGASFIPHAFVAAINARSAGIVQFGVETEGLNKIVRNLMDRSDIFKAIITGELSLKELLKTHTSESSYAMLRQLFNKMPFANYEHPEVVINAYIKAFGHHLTYFAVNEHEIIQLVEKTMRYFTETLTSLKTRQEINFVKTLGSVNNAIMIPTPAGFPVNLNFTVVAMMKIQGDIQAEGFSYLQSWRSLFQVPSVTFKTNIVTSFFTHEIVTCGAMIGSINAVSVYERKTHAQVPIDGAITVSFADMTVKMNINTPTREFQLFGITVPVPATAIIERNMDVSRVVFNIEKQPIQAIAAMKRQFSVPVEEIHNAFGLEANVVGFFVPGHDEILITYPRAIDARLVVRPGRDVPQAYELMFALITPFTVNPMARREEIFPTSQTYRSHYRTKAVFAVPEDIAAPHEWAMNNHKFQLIAAYRAIGGNTQRNIHLQATYITEAALMHHKIHVEFQCTPIFRYQYEPAKITVDTEFHIPAVIFQTWSHVAIPAKEIFINAAVHYNNQIIYTVKGFFGSSLNVHKPMPQYITSYAPAVPQMVSVAFEIEEGEYHIPPQYTMMMVTYIREYLAQFHQLQFQAAIQPNAFGKATIIASFIPQKNMVEFALAIPEMTQYVRFELPGYMAFRPAMIHAQQPVYRNLLMLATPKTKKDVCNVHGEKVQTFDMFTYTIPKSECEAVLIKDCTHKKFAVTFKNSPVTTEKKIIRVMVEDKEIEIVPLESKHSSKILVDIRVDGQKVEMKNTLKIKDSKNDLLVIIEHTAHNIKVKCSKYGFTLKTDMHQIKIKISKMALSSICGVCGDLVKKPEERLEIHKDIEKVAKFVEQYLVPTSQCRPEEVEREMIHLAGKAGKGGKAATCATQERNIVAKKYINGKDMVCISRKPVAVCTEKCKRSQPIEEKVPFYCIAADTNKAEKIQEEAKTKPVYDFADGEEESDLWIEVPTQESCQPIY